MGLDPLHYGRRERRRLCPRGRLARQVDGEPVETLEKHGLVGASASFAPLSALRVRLAGPGLGGGLGGETLGQGVLCLRQALEAGVGLAGAALRFRPKAADRGGKRFQAGHDLVQDGAARFVLLGRQGSDPCIQGGEYRLDTLVQCVLAFSEAREDGAGRGLDIRGTRHRPLHRVECAVQVGIVPAFALVEPGEARIGGVLGLGDALDCVLQGCKPVLLGGFGPVQTGADGGVAPGIPLHPVERSVQMVEHGLHACPETALSLVETRVGPGVFCGVETILKRQERGAKGGVERVGTDGRRKGVEPGVECRQRGLRRSGGRHGDRSALADRGQPMGHVRQGQGGPGRQNEADPPLG